MPNMEVSDNDSEKNKNKTGKSVHDEVFTKIFEAENRSVSRFFDAVFGFFYRNSPKNVFSSSQYYGKQVLLSNYEKWDKKYQATVDSPLHSTKRIRSETPIEDESPSVKEESDSCWQAAANPGGPTHTTNTATVSKRSQSDKKDTVLTESKKEKGDEESKISSFDTTNGAVLDNYSWTQTVDDLEVRLPVKGFIRKANQVRVQITEQHLTVEVQREEKSPDFVVWVDGPLKKSVRLDGSVWLLSPEQHISILLEKESETWWDRLLTSEEPIDMKKINAERDFSSLPEEERLCIERVIAERLREERGEPSSDQQKLESVLRKAWDAEGSPFKGRPFDPSLVQVVNSSS